MPDQFTVTGAPSKVCSTDSFQPLMYLIWISESQLQDDWKGENLQSYGGDTVDVDAYSTVCVP